MNDRPNFKELEQQAAQQWRTNALAKAMQQAKVKEIMGRPWNCPTCGMGGLRDPICPKCRSARIVELE